MAENDFRLNIIVVGAGLCGLASSVACALGGHNVTVLEAAPELAEIGAGLQITPNGSRLLREWGIEDVEKESAEPGFLAVHRYSDGKLLAYEKDWPSKLRQRYGAPMLDVHRADLQQHLYQRALSLGVKVELGARVASVKPDEAEVILQSGQRRKGDLVVGADGLWSKCREALLGCKDEPLPTGDLAYRIVLTLDQIDDPELREWMAKPACHLWFGPESHAVAYSMKGGTMYNIVLLRPDDLPKDVARRAGAVDEMKKLFEDWDPILRRFLDHVTAVDKWRLMHRAEMDSWTNKAGNFTLVGDSCHPMLPYLAQGANSAMEDGAVLGRVLGSVRSKDQLPRAIRLFERLRKARSEAIVRETFHQRDDIQMPDGAPQQKRDEFMLAYLDKEEIDAKFPSRWTCPEVTPWLFGYDAIKEADMALEKYPFTSSEHSLQAFVDGLRNVAGRIGGLMRRAVL